MVLLQAHNMTTNILVLFTIKALMKLQSYVAHADGEISGMGLVEKQGNKLIIQDLYLIEQESGQADTKMDGQALAKLYDQLSQQGIDESKLKLWWHSHGDIGVCWSGTDEATIEDWNQEREDNNWFLSVVTNKRGDMKVRIDVFSPFRIILDDLPWKFDLFDSELDKQIAEEVKQKVKTKKWKPLRTPKFNISSKGHITIPNERQIPN